MQSSEEVHKHIHKTERRPFKKPIWLMELSIYSLLPKEYNFRNRRKWPHEEHFPEVKHTTFSEKPKLYYKVTNQQRYLLILWPKTVKHAI